MEGRQRKMRGAPLRLTKKMTETLKGRSEIVVMSFAYDCHSNGIVIVMFFSCAVSFIVLFFLILWNLLTL